MKKTIAMMMASLTLAAALAGCGQKQEDPGVPPEEIIHPGIVTEATQAQSSPSPVSEEPNILEKAVTVRIGQRSNLDWDINIIDNAETQTMLSYLSRDMLLFPSYTYEEDSGFVAQHIRGSYGRDDEATYTDVHVGDLFLFGDGQLRLYFKDVEGINLTATLVGTFADPTDLTQTVQKAYAETRDDVWGVDVYFMIVRNY